MIVFPIAMLVIPAAIAQPSENAKLLPSDEASKDLSFLKFRNELLALIQRRDSKALMKLIHKDTEISFGGSKGSKDFIEWWHPEDPSSKLWTEIEVILHMGGAFNSEGKFEAPYVSAKWPQEFDGFEHSAITGKNVRCYSAPNQKLRPITTLSFDIVKTTVDDSNFEEYKSLLKRGWRKIELLNGMAGYVRAKYVRGGVDQRIYFSKGSNGNWFIDAFIAGD